MLLEVALLFVASLVGLLVYLIPSFWAFNKDHEQKIPILAVNFFTGWTVIGFIACCVWASRD